MFSLQPQTGDAYFWQSEIESAVKHLRSKRNLLVLAPAKMGKSSFLLNLAERLRESKFTPIIFSAEHCMTLNEYIRRNTLAVLSAHPGIFGKDVKSFFSLSILEIDRTISQLNASDAVKQSLKLLLMYEHDSRSDMIEVIRCFFGFPALIAEDAKSVSVILVDDSDSIKGLKSGEASLEMIFDDAEKTGSAFVFASAVRLPLSDVETISLQPLSLDDVRKFLKGNKLDLNESALSTLYNMTGGSPFYLNFFCRRISHSSAKDSAAVSEIVEDSLINELGLYYSERIKHLSPKELPILFCMAEHNVNTPSRISKLLDYSQTNVRRFLSIMEEKGFVTLKERGVFEINDAVFRKWLEKRAKS